MGLLRVDNKRKWQLDLEHKFDNLMHKDAPVLLNHQLQTIIDRLNLYTEQNQKKVEVIEDDILQISSVSHVVTVITGGSGTFSTTCANLDVILIGGGGGGGGGRHGWGSAFSPGGSGGAGGAWKKVRIPILGIMRSFAYSVGAGGSGGPRGYPGQNGGSGGNTSFGIDVSYGGGGGCGGYADGGGGVTGGSGGGRGGPGAVGQSPSAYTIKGGVPGKQEYPPYAIGGNGAPGVNGGVYTFPIAQPGCAEFGGGCGGGVFGSNSSTQSQKPGGNSLYGGGGGGAGSGTFLNDGYPQDPTDGGAQNCYILGTSTYNFGGGGGGEAGTYGSKDGSPGNDFIYLGMGGQGGGGGYRSTTSGVAAGNGGGGGYPGGGGGGGGGIRLSSSGGLYLGGKGGDGAGGMILIIEHC